MRNFCLPGVRLAAAAGLLAAALGVPSTASAQDSHTRWVFAEGVYDQGGFFRQEVLVTNPSAEPVRAALQLLTPAGRCDVGRLPSSALTNIPATSQYQYVIDFGFVAHFCPDLPASSGVTVVVETTGPVVASRSMSWGGQQRRGLTSEVGASGPGKTIWYFAEGAAVGPFDTFFALANLESDAAEVEVTYLLESGAPRTDRVTVPASGRETVRAPHGIGPFGAIVKSTNGVPFYVERAMYWSNFLGGHVAKGLAAPKQEWHLPDAANFDGHFVTYVTLANHETTPIDVDIDYVTDAGTETVTYAVRAQGRRTILVGAPGHGGPRNASFSMVARSDAPFLAEGSMYVAGMTEGSALSGASTPARRWAFADGATGGSVELLGDSDPGRFDTFYAISNPNGATVQVEARFYRQDGSGTVETYQVAPNGRTLIHVSNGDLADQRFGAVFIATERVVVAGATYYDRGAAAVTGTPWASRPSAVPPEPPEPPPPPPAAACNIGNVEADFRQLIQGQPPHQNVLINHVYPSLRAKYGASCIVLGASFGGTIEDLWVGGMWVDVLFNNTTQGARYWWWHPHAWDPDLRYPFTP